jgi:hypothetical protein
MVRTCTRCKIEKPLAEFSKDKSRRDGLHSHCKVCSAEQIRKWQKANREKEAERLRKWQKANPEKIAEQKRKYREANTDKVAEYQRKYYEANKEKERERSRKYYEANPEKGREYQRKYREANKEKVAEQIRKWQKDNPDKRAALSAKRRSQKLQATPAWADLKAIEAVYEESAWLTQCLGIEHHVDHIIPLQGKKVCGLHVHNNLQVLPAKTNLAKGNRYKP